MGNDSTERRSSDNDANTVADGGASARWIVCEKTGRWALALRRQPEAAGRRIHEVRSLLDGWELLKRAPESFLVLELTAGNCSRLLEGLLEIERHFPRGRVAVVAERSLAACESAVREAGAVWFTTSPREVRPIASLAARHVARARAPVRTTTERVWDSLPWRMLDE
jgi:hypothetical protein